MGLPLKNSRSYREFQNAVLLRVCLAVLTWDVERLQIFEQEIVWYVSLVVAYLER